MSAGHDWLAAPLVPLAWCWRIERRDGVLLGLTTHDRDLTIDHLIYRSAPGIRPTALTQRRGVDGDRMDIEGALSADAVTADDLVAGRWDGARLSLFVADWEAPDERRLPIAEGVLGAVEMSGGRFTAELRSATAGLSAPAVPETRAACRATLGDRACRVALAPLTHRARVVAQAGTQVTLDRVFAADALAGGTLRWLDGGNRGLTTLVLAKEADGAWRLADPPPLAVVAGARIELIEGCDKRAATCRDRFANIANFRGEPHLPGLDLLTRYPGG